ncbi:hypothetical protein CesoFtcFv8_012221 [Champsocephalus esox]|uniref:Uncharacterized protein n=1 Tax=Champsocephalus esox TaxID=159716 RepID=A0AAN8BX71_9TELE|nr:hypothetical protein CesoFtcFv8_012221 [Champsocephalus esox]
MHSRGLEGCLLPCGPGNMVPYIQFLRPLGRLPRPFGPLALRPMQMWLNSLHLDAKWHRRREVRVLRRCLHSRSHWKGRAYLLMGVPMGTIPSRHETVTIGTGLSGWGAVWQGWTVQGQWSAQEGARHANVLELRAVQLALTHFLPLLGGKNAHVPWDSMYAVAQTAVPSRQWAFSLHSEFMWLLFLLDIFGSTAPRRGATGR